MSFWEFEASDDIALRTDSEVYTYKCLRQIISEINLVSSNKELILLLCENKVETIVNYLASLKAGHTVMLMGEDTNKELLDRIVLQYQPKWIFGEKKFEGYRFEEGISTRMSKLDVHIHPDTAILLSTSGTTGSQKFVRLSYENIQSNAKSIAEYLQLEQNERAIMNLPMSYSYGMSIINSHLQVGATILLTDESVMEKKFWEFVKEQQATSLAGVPFTYQMLQRIGFMKMDLPHLKTLTQAGGRLNEKLVRAFAEYAKEQDKHLYVMYGQTEAAPRMSYIPPERVLEKAGSIGIAIPGGELMVDVETSELIYKGPNVMMGYAECLEDLAKGDEMNGVLHTGDTAMVDADGYFTITGRLKRFIKLFGLRINLDDVEKKLESEIHAAIACVGNDDKLIVAIENEQLKDDVKATIERYYKLHKTAYKVIVLEQIPRFASGKIDYVTLKEEQG